MAYIEFCLRLAKRGRRPDGSGVFLWVRLDGGATSQGPDPLVAFRWLSVGKSVECRPRPLVGEARARSECQSSYWRLNDSDMG